MTLALAERPIDHDHYRPDYLRRILGHAQTIAVVGASTDPWRASYGIMRYLQRHGYRIVPVNPFERGKSVHGERFYDSLGDIPHAVDLVDVFRRPDAIGGVVDDAIAAHATAIWLQLGIRDDAAAGRAEAAGLLVVQNRCISVEHARLMR